MDTDKGMDKEQVLKTLNDNADMMLAICRKVCGSDDFAVEEAMSDAVVLVWQNWQQFDGRSLFSTWIYRVTYNAAYAIAKTSGKDNGTVLKEDLEAAVSLWAGEPYDALERSETDKADSDKADRQRRMLDDACSQLYDEEKEVIQCLRQGLTTKETAAHLNLPLGTVRTTLKKAKRKLKRIIRNSNEYRNE